MGWCLPLILPMQCILQYMKWPSSWEERDQNSFITLFFPSFEWLSHCVCMQASMWTHGCLLRYQEADRRWDGSLPLHSFSLRGPRCCQHCQGSVFSSPMFGQNSLNTAQNQSIQEILWATAWQGGVLGMLFGAKKQLEELWRRQIRDKPSSCAHFKHHG